MDFSAFLLRRASLVVALVWGTSAQGIYNLEKVSEFVPPGLIHLTNAEVHRGVIYGADFGVLTSLKLSTSKEGTLDPSTLQMNRAGMGFNVIPHHDLLLFLKRESGVTAFDVSISPEPKPLGGLGIFARDTSFESGDFTGNNHLLLAAHAAGVVTYDFSGYLDAEGKITADSNSAAPEPIHGFGESKDAWDLIVVGDVVYIADGPHGLRIASVDQNGKLTALSHLAIPGVSQDVHVIGDKAFLAASSEGVAVVDVADPSAPRLLGQYRTTGSATHIDADSSRIYVADMDDIEVIDYSDPGNLRLVGLSPVADRAMGIDYHDGYIYVAAWGRFEIFRFDPRPGPAVNLNISRFLQFPRAPVGGTVEQPLIIRNLGDEDLRISSITFHNPEFVGPESEVLIPPKEERTVTLSHTPASGEYREATGTVHSNDPEQGELDFVVAGNRNGVMPGDTAGDFAVRLLDGTTWESTQHKGKKHIILSFFAPW